jgi:hypothetical protein
MTIEPCRVEDSYSLLTDPDPAFQKSSDPDLDFEAQNNIFCREISEVLFEFKLLEIWCSSRWKNINNKKLGKRKILEDVVRNLF